MLFNQHIHTVHSDGQASMLTMCQAAAASGLELITFCDHSPLPPQFPRGVSAINRLEPAQYKAAFAALPRHGAVQATLGIEIEFIENSDGWLKSYVDDPHFDLLIGSVHFLPDYDQVIECLSRFVNSKSHYKSIRDLYCEYFRVNRVICQSGNFQILGHLDNVSRQNAGHYFSETEPEYRREVHDTLKALQKSGMAYEVNTAGLTKSCGRANPDQWICEQAFQLGIPVTVTTDAHCPENLLQGMVETRAMLRMIGYTELALVRNRDIVTVPL